MCRCRVVGSTQRQELVAKWLVGLRPGSLGYSQQGTSSGKMASLNKYLGKTVSHNPLSKPQKGRAINSISSTCLASSYLQVLDLVKLFWDYQYQIPNSFQSEMCSQTTLNHPMKDAYILPISQMKTLWFRETEAVSEAWTTHGASDHPSPPSIPHPSPPSIPHRTWQCGMQSKQTHIFPRQPARRKKHPAWAPRN